MLLLNRQTEKKTDAKKLSSLAEVHVLITSVSVCLINCWLMLQLLVLVLLQSISSTWVVG